MDARIVRTRRRLQDALFALAGERGIDHVTIGDIAQRAGVNRSTFYQHYADKETLLADALDAIAAEAGAGLDGFDPGEERAPDVLVRFLSHLEHNADVYARVFTEPGYGAVLARLREHVRQAVREFSQRPDGEMPRDIPVDVLAAGIAGTLIGVTGAWLELEDRPPAQEAAQWVWRAVRGPVPLDR